MATASLTTSPTTIDTGASDNVSITNTGAVDVTITRGSQSFTLRPTQGRVIYPEGAAVTAATVSGTGSVSYTATAARQSQVQQYAADPAFAGTYAQFTQAGKETLRTADAAALRPFHAALGARNWAPVDVLMIGDSFTEGRGATLTARSLTVRVTAALRQTLQPSGIAGGFGYLSAWSGSSATAGGGTITDYPVALAGAPDTTDGTYGVSRRNIFLSSGQSATFTITGTGFDIFWVQGPALGTFTYAVDGGSTTTVTSTGGAAPTSGHRTQVTGLSAGSHTVVLTRLTGVNVIEGLMVYNGDEAAGIRVWNAGRGGSTASNFAGNTQ
jgi:hypothetical protein